VDRRIGIGSIVTEGDRTIGHSWNKTVAGVDHGMVGLGIVIGRMIEVDSVVIDGDSLRIASTRCPGCQRGHRSIKG
jgi:hypothetical protein